MTKCFITFFIFIAILVLFQACPRNPETIPQGLDDIIAGFDELFDAEIGKTIPGAVILLIKNGEVYHKGAFGYKNLENSIKMTTDTVFRVASISKTIAALRAMRLVEDGTISLDDEVDNYESRRRFPASMHGTQMITFRKLLSHNVGTRPHFYYMDAKYNILQLEMRLITRRFLAEYAATNIFTPLDMKSSFYDNELIPAGKLATPYNNDLGPPPYVFLSEAWHASGGLYTTAGDLASLIIEIMKCYREEENNFMLDRETLLLMLTPHAHGLMVPGLHTGLGFFITEHDSGMVTYSHGGIMPGWRAHYEFNLETGDGIIILTNGDNGGLLLIQPLLREWLSYQDSLR